MNTIFVSVILILLFAGCASRSTPIIDDSQLVGLSVADAIMASGMKTDTARIIDEPPGVPRAISGEAGGDSLVELYVKRGSVPFNTKRDWEISVFFDQIVIGVARETETGWAASGEVMLIRAQAAAAKKKESANKAAHPTAGSVSP